MDGAGGCDRLAFALLRAADDPTEVAALHELLGPFCHRARNLLHGFSLGLHLAKAELPSNASLAWSQVEQSYRALERLIEQIQLACQPMRIAPIRLSLGALLRERRPVWSEWLAAGGRALELVAPQGADVGSFDLRRLTQALDLLFAWRAAVTAPNSMVRIAWAVDRDQMVLEWTEPDTALSAQAAEPDEVVSLALPIMARVAKAHGGTLEIGTTAGARITLRWPCDLEFTCVPRGSPVGASSRGAGHGFAARAV